MTATPPAKPFTVLARMDGWCPACGEMIEAGGQIVLPSDGKWVHGDEGSDCFSEWEGV